MSALWRGSQPRGLSNIAVAVIVLVVMLIAGRIIFSAVVGLLHLVIEVVVLAIVLTVMYHVVVAVMNAGEKKS